MESFKNSEGSDIHPLLRKTRNSFISTRPQTTVRAMRPPARPACLEGLAAVILCPPRNVDHFATLATCATRQFIVSSGSNANASLCGAAPLNASCAQLNTLSRLVCRPNLNNILPYPSVTNEPPCAVEEDLISGHWMKSLSFEFVE